MRIGMLGTGMVGQNLGGRLLELGHEVMLGAREPGNPTAAEWAAESGGRHGCFADAAAHGEVLVNATRGTGSLAALQQAKPADLDGKVLLDIANPLDRSTGFPPTLNPVNTDSLGEQIQAAFPGLRVVKTLNTMLVSVMVDPAHLPSGHDVFMAGEDAAAKEVAKGLLVELGWPPEHILDLGGIRESRGTEMYMALWIALATSLDNWDFNISVVRNGSVR